MAYYSWWHYLNCVQHESKLVKSNTQHDNGSLKTTLSATNPISNDAKEKLVISTRRYDDKAWRNKES